MKKLIHRQTDAIDKVVYELYNLTPDEITIIQKTS